MKVKHLKSDINVDIDQLVDELKNFENKGDISVHRINDLGYLLKNKEKKKEDVFRPSWSGKLNFGADKKEEPWNQHFRCGR